MLSNYTLFGCISRTFTDKPNIVMKTMYECACYYSSFWGWNERIDICTKFITDISQYLNSKDTKRFAPSTSTFQGNECMILKMHGETSSIIYACAIILRHWCVLPPHNIVFRLHSVLSEAVDNKCVWRLKTIYFVSIQPFHGSQYSIL